MALDGISHCDIIGELNGRSIYCVTDKIFLSLDWSSLKDASLVSKAWREAVLVTMKTIVMKGNPNWSAKDIDLWQKIRSHLKLDFHVSTEDPLYTQRFTNSLKLVLERLQGEWLKPEATLDYVPFSHQAGHGCKQHQLDCHIEMNEKFIVAWDPKTQLLNFWSRRTLSPLKMDQNFGLRKFPVKLGGAGMNFQLSGNYLVYGEMFKGDDDCAVSVIKRVDLEAKCRGVGEPAETVICSCVVPSVVAGERSLVLIRHLWVDKDFLALMFALKNDKSTYHVSVLWKAQDAKAVIDLRSSVLQVPSLNLSDDTQCFLDANYFVAKWSYQGGDMFSSRTGFRTYSIHPTKAGGPVELRWKASFEVSTCDVPRPQVDYKSGVLASASVIGDITLVDVAKGAILIVIRTTTNLRREIRLSRNYLMCSERDGLSMLVPAISKTCFYIWDLETLKRQSAQGVQTRDWMKPFCAFKTLAGSLVNLKVDELGIVAAAENDPDKGIQVLSFVPACNRCKRVTKPSLLKKCSRCKSATYCSRECQAADWNPHHKFICKK